VHEVAIASLRGEFQRQSSELKLAEEEVSRLRNSLAKKVNITRINSSIFCFILCYYYRSSNYFCCQKNLQGINCDRIGLHGLMIIL
jgi:hypothetical protein